MRKPRASDENWIQAKRRRVAARQNWLCCWCGQPMCLVHNCPRQASLEHLKPKHNGGATRPGNLAAACRKCNSERHPEMMLGKRQPKNLYATSGETESVSPFEILRSLKS